MQRKRDQESGDETIRHQVFSGFEEAKEFAKSLDFDEVGSGAWFLSLLQRVVRSYDHNARARYFQQKYPGLSPDNIADILISVTTRYAAIAGGVAGATATANQLTTVASAGMTAPLFFGTIGTEMLYLARIQMRLVLDLSVVYDLRLDPDDPEDVLMVFGYALGVAPTDLIGAGSSKAAGEITKRTVKRVISGDVLKAIQRFAQRLGFKILQRTILKYAVPAASAVVGSSYNYATTKSLGRIARAHLKDRGKVTGELRTLLAHRDAYELVFPAAALYIARVDGKLSSEEEVLYRAMLTRMSFDEYTQEEFQKLTSSETGLLEAAARIEDADVRRALVGVLALMAVCDGELAVKEREFLTSVAGRLNVPLDLDEVERETRDYRAVSEPGTFDRTAEAASGATVRARDTAGRTADGVRGAAQRARREIKGSLGKVLGRGQNTRI